MSTPTTPATRPAIWAESGTTVEPDTGSQQSGFVAGKPGRGKTNWLLNWLDNAVQFLLENPSGVVSSGISASGGATITNAHSMNFPGGNHKIIAFCVNIPLTAGDGSTTITLTGGAAFVVGARTCFVSSVGGSAGAPGLYADVGSGDGRQLCGINITNGGISSSSRVNVMITGY